MCYIDFNQRNAQTPKQIQINKYMYHTSSSIQIPWTKEWLHFQWQKWRIKAFSAKYLYFSHWFSLKVSIILFSALKRSIEKIRNFSCYKKSCKKFCPILVQLQIPPAYIVQNTTGCLFISLSESIADNCSLWILFNKEPLCILADLHKPVPSVDINQNYKGRIQCSVTESYNQASICFTTGIQPSDAGVYAVRLFKSPDEFITNNTLHVIGMLF